MYRMLSLITRWEGPRCNRILFNLHPRDLWTRLPSLGGTFESQNKTSNFFQISLNFSHIQLFICTWDMWKVWQNGREVLKVSENVRCLRKTERSEKNWEICERCEKNWDPLEKVREFWKIEKYKKRAEKFLKSEICEKIVKSVTKSEECGEKVRCD